MPIMYLDFHMFGYWNLTSWALINSSHLLPPPIKFAIRADQLTCPREKPCRLKLYVQWVHVINLIIITTNFIWLSNSIANSISNSISNFSLYGVRLLASRSCSETHLTRRSQQLSIQYKLYKYQQSAKTQYTNIQCPVNNKLLQSGNQINCMNSLNVG